MTMFHVKHVKKLLLFLYSILSKLFPGKYFYFFDYIIIGTSLLKNNYVSRETCAKIVILYIFYTI